MKLDDAIRALRYHPRAVVKRWRLERVDRRPKQQPLPLPGEPCPETVEIEAIGIYRAELGYAIRLPDDPPEMVMIRRDRLDEVLEMLRNLKAATA